MKETTILMIGLLLPLLGTMIGSAFVFMIKNEMSARLQKSLLGFASGVMVAASVWSLLIPAMEMKADSGAWSVVPASVGFLLGIGFLLLIDEITPHLHIGTDKPEGLRSHLSKTAMLALAVTIHNLPEGMAVGVVFAGAENGATHISLAAAISVSLGIAIQNIPEGAIISMPMRAAGNSRWKSFMLGSLSGVVEPIGALAVILLATHLMPTLPYMLAFAAGAMFYVVVEELIPEASSGQHSNLSTIGFAIGFPIGGRLLFSSSLFATGFPIGGRACGLSGCACLVCGCLFAPSVLTCAMLAAFTVPLGCSSFWPSAFFGAALIIVVSCALFSFAIRTPPLLTIVYQSHLQLHLLNSYRQGRIFPCLPSR